MKRLFLVQSLAGGVVAQHMTLPLFHNAIVAAADPAVSGSEACSAAIQHAQNCVSQAGGTQGVLTMNPASLVKCACCDGGHDIAASYATCSSLLSKAAPTATSRYSRYGVIYSMCSASGSVCAGGAASTGAPSSTNAPSSSDASDPKTLTSSESIGSLGPECTSMVGLFQSCTSAIQGFADLPFGQQAPCYCCVTAHGQASWTDQFDKYAQTCRDWAKASGPQTVYSLAETFAGFCKKFSDACSASSTLPSTPATATLTDVRATSTSSTGGQTSRTTASTSAPTSTGAASSLRVGHAAALVAAAAVAVAF